MPDTVFITMENILTTRACINNIVLRLQVLYMWLYYSTKMYKKWKQCNLSEPSCHHNRFYHEQVVLIY